jgi:hypothetical protein
MRSIRSSLILVLGLFATGCIGLGERSIDHDFAGLRSTMGRTHTVCMLLVHGMGGYSVGDPQALIAGVQKELKLKPLGPAQTIMMPDPAIGTAASLDRQDFAAANGQRLRIYALHWEPLTEAIKKQFLGYDDAPALTRLRLPLHNDLKQGMMNTNVPDVILYTGKFRPVLQGAVKFALQRIRADMDGDDDYEYFFVTFSLGSTIIFDVVDEMDNEADGNHSDEIVDRTASFFMLANQLPLLGLGEVGPTSRPADTADGGYKSSLQFVKRKYNRRQSGRATTAAATPDLSIVAVNDPNDMFSYTIPPTITRQYPGTYVNVIMSVAKTGYLLPSLGYVLNPMTAHTGYGHDPDVFRLIVEGGKATKAIQR